MVDLSFLRLSVEIALSTCLTFVAGRLICWLTPKSGRGRAVVRVVVLILAAGVALYFYFSPSSRYALLLPAAFAIGCWSLDRGRPVQLFERKD